MPAPRQMPVRPAGPDTIVARATPPGLGGIAVIRLSGPRVRDLARQLLGDCPPPRRAVLRHFRDRTGEALDNGLALFFPGPRSYTGEDVLELQGHGAPVVSALLVEECLALGARLARPGEFTERAFLNDRLDLLQAEAVADLINAGSRAAARAAQRTLDGAFSALVHELNDQVTALRIHVEAAIDFPEEEVDFLAAPELKARLDEVADSFARLRQTVARGRLLRDGLHVVLAGRPNSGKSSLLNALAGYEAAIVTAIPGTTRDVVRENLELEGLPLHVVDTAGLRLTRDPVEAEGVRRARAELAVADLALLIVDAADPADAGSLRAELPPDLAVVEVRNKVDLTGDTPGEVAGQPDTVNISARTGAGLADLRRLLLARAGFTGAGGDTITARQRHVETLERARAHFEAGRKVLEQQGAGELLAEELREVQNALAEITGEFSSDDLLGKIFASFCIGK